MDNGQDTKKNASRKGKDLSGAYMALLLVAIGFAIGAWITAEGKRQDNDRRALDAYLVDNNCVVAQMQGRDVKTYRCDRPAPGTYISAVEVNQAIKAGTEAK